jgi:hypothetical protein
MTKVKIDFSTCRGCAPNATFHYEVLKIPSHIRYLGKTIIPPASAIRGGSNIESFSFDKNELYQKTPTIIIFGKFNGYNQLVDKVSRSQ